MKRNRSMDDDEDVARRGHGRDDAPTHLGAQAYLEYILYLSIPCRAHECHPGRSWRDSSAAAQVSNKCQELALDVIMGRQRKRRRMRRKEEEEA